MANEEQLSILKQGVEVWNKWRAENVSVEINLRGANLVRADLRTINFREADLLGANLSEADVSEASLMSAKLNKAYCISTKLEGADLTEVDLSETDLSEANLNEANLNEGNLSDANLHGATFIGADLNAANLNGAILIGAKLIAANLNEATLIGANLSEASLNEATLKGVNLTGANLSGANLHDVLLYLANLYGSDLTGSNFSNASVESTFFIDLDLRDTKGLEDVIHTGPSHIATDTLTLSKGKIPEEFLLGCGLSDLQIEYAKLHDPELSNEVINKILYKIYDLRATQAVQISPLFISYSHADTKFVDRFESQLQKKGIRFWRDIHEMKAGRIETQIDRAISQNRTVLLILSEHSIKSDWVEHEVRMARGMEKELGRDVLCPVALDDSWKSSPWPARVMEQIKEYNILDFSAWEDDVKFEGMFRKLIDGLELFYRG